ncbi:MAG: twin-arginine translocase TatA/TatE family subunit [Planctomycetes bacterium]|nr:twin-arginine translocase TatA/TatE family subunit [Planctomycetota bacterium]MBT4029713.1 twin-arginine translocase TatA/TatE family subunit [Planctomycetota bacterium]MBT4561213.1 twin-arginine translocase TatA/TatE family subunit [Planctomycetota bacterium]MBT5101342.1 twin-arginine translocase TatA/TatE family subunit [Planctomycetota bacterium]MBT5120766.1 twin-arginine translocase TatA/TatE family subunit [Planctomycetota bacterium]
MPGGMEMMWVALVALLLFGGAKLPGLMRGLGQGVNELKKGLKEGSSDDEKKLSKGDDDSKPEA